MGIDQIEQQIKQKELELRQLQIEISKLKDLRRNQLLRIEERRLKRQAKTVTLWLGFFISLSSIGIVWLLGWPADNKAALVCLAAGFLGSSVSAMLSALERKANGWEFSDGTAYPDDAPKQRFNERMTYFYLARPFLGATVGLLVFVGAVSGFLITVGSTPNLYKLTFVSMLAGLFAKTLLEKLKNVFDNLFGK